MHNLLCQLKADPQISVTKVHDLGHSMYIGVRHEAETAGLVVRKRAPLHAEDVRLIRDGERTNVPGDGLVERIRSAVNS